MPRSTRSFDMRMSDSSRPTGMASGNATATMPTAMRKPWNTTGKLVTMSDGLKNRRRNLLEFHAFTQSCCSSHWASCSVGEVPFTVMGVMSSMGFVVSSASV